MRPHLRLHIGHGTRFCTRKTVFLNSYLKKGWGILHLQEEIYSSFKLGANLRLVPDWPGSPPPPSLGELTVIKALFGHKSSDLLYDTQVVITSSIPTNQ